MSAFENRRLCCTDWSYAVAELTANTLPLLELCPPYPNTSNTGFFKCLKHLTTAKLNNIDTDPTIEDPANWALTTTTTTTTTRTTTGLGTLNFIFSTEKY